MDEVKYQELLDAANHAEHNGGRVVVDHDVLRELLAAWKDADEGIFEPVPVLPTIAVSAEDLDRIAEEEKAKEDTSGNPPEPTVQ